MLVADEVEEVRVRRAEVDAGRRRPGAPWSTRRGEDLALMRDADDRDVGLGTSRGRGAVEVTRTPERGRVTPGVEAGDSAGGEAGRSSSGVAAPGAVEEEVGAAKSEETQPGSVEKKRHGVVPVAVVRRGCDRDDCLSPILTSEMAHME